RAARLTALTSAVQGDHGAGARSGGLLVDQRGGSHVLKRGAGAVEDGDLRRRGAPWLAAGHHLTELGVHVRASDPPCLDRVMDLADRDALIEDIGYHLRGRQDRRIELLLVGAVRPDGSDERSRPQESRLEKGRAGRRASDADVTLGRRDVEGYGRRDVNAQLRRHLGGVRSGARGIDVPSEGTSKW